MGTADSAFSSLIPGSTNLAGSGANLAGNVINNPYSGGYQAGAGTAGNYLTGTLAPQLQGNASNLSSMATAAMPYATSILQAGFDPQNALYNRTQQQVMDQTNSNLAASGVASTPYGAGVAGMTDANFNIDWQNNQLSRESTALSGYGGIMSGIGSAYGQAGALGDAGASATVTGAGLPYSTYTGMQSTGLGALGGAQSLYSGASGIAGNYLGLGNQGYGNELAAEQQQYTQNSGLFSGLGGLFGMGLDSLGFGGAFGQGGLFGSSVPGSIVR